MFEDILASGMAFVYNSVLLLSLSDIMNTCMCYVHWPSTH